MERAILQRENMKRLIRVLLFAYVGLLLAMAIVFIGGVALGDNPIFQDVTLDLTTLIRGIPPGVYIMMGALMLIPPDSPMGYASF